MKKEDKKIHRYRYKDKTLIQEHTKNYTCKGCFFKLPQYLHRCCIKINGVFLYPCTNDIIYIEDDKSK